jgi:hypothetical protein
MTGEIKKETTFSSNPHLNSSSDVHALNDG